MNDYEHHSVTSEKIDGGSVITESHHANGTHSQTRTFVPGRAPSKDLTKLISMGPSERGTGDGAGSKGLKGVKAYMGTL
jgi:hypothetical protein